MSLLEYSVVYNILEDEGDTLLGKINFGNYFVANRCLQLDFGGKYYIFVFESLNGIFLCKWNTEIYQPFLPINIS